MSRLFSVAQSIPHRGAMSFLTSIDGFSAERQELEASLELAGHKPYWEDGLGFCRQWMPEAMAQCVAALYFHLSQVEQQSHAVAPSVGFLVAISSFEWLAPKGYIGAIGDIWRLSSRLDVDLSPFAKFECTAHMGEVLLAQAQMSFMTTDKEREL